MSDFAKVEHKPAFVVAGLRENIDRSSGTAQLWEKVSHSIKLAGAHPANAQQVAIIFGISAQENMDYMAGVLIDTKENASKLGLNAAEVPAGEYAIVDVKGPASLASPTGMDYLLGTFIPERGLLPNGPTIEIYGPGDTSSEDYAMQVWVPVKAA